MKCLHSVFASLSNAQALDTGLPRQDQAWITAEQFVRFHQTQFDEMPCKLGDFTECARLFQPNLVLP